MIINSSATNYVAGIIDNIKIWNEVISDTAWEYNSGTGVEDALHYIYGAGNGYEPNNTQVGYFLADSGGSYSQCSNITL